MNSFNPAWPRMDEAVSFSSGPNSTMPAPFWASMIGRTEGTWTSQRGRQYELDQVQTGQVTTTFRNDDGAFDASNTASPYYPKVTPLRAYRRRAQYPRSANLLTQDQATAFYSTRGAYTGSDLPHWIAGASGPSFTTSIGPHDATTNEYVLGLYQTSSMPLRSLEVFGWSVTPGQIYSGQATGFLSGAGVLPSRLLLEWYDATGSIIGTVNGAAATLTGSDALMTVTGTAPADACGASLAFTSTGPSAGGSCSAHLRAIQLEASGSASSWVLPGVWFDMFTGYIERFPQAWDTGGTYGTTDPKAIDAYGYLSQRTLLSPGYMEVLAMNPAFFYPLDEPAGNGSFADLTANRPTMPVRLYPWAGEALATTFLAGQALSGGIPQGISGPVAQFQTPPAHPYMPGLDLGSTVPGPVGPPTTSGWCRFVGFRTTTDVYTQVIWGAVDSADQNALGLGLYPSTGQLGITLLNSGVVYPPGGLHGGPDVYDGNYHLGAAVMSEDGTTLSLWLDGVLIATNTESVDVRPTLDATSTENYGLFISGLGGIPQQNFFGWLTFVGGFDYEPSPDQMVALYSAFQYAGSGMGTASSGTRFADILRWGRWAGATRIDNPATGTTRRYGPSTDLLAAAGSTGTDVVTALQAVAVTDNGESFVDKSGAARFTSRGARYNKTPVLTFGEDKDAGEIPYTTTGLDNDPTHLANDVALTQVSTGLTFRKLDQASIDEYGDVPLTNNINTLDVDEIRAQQTYILATEAVPLQRIQTLVIDVSTNPDVWPDILGLELGDCVKMMRRPPGAPVLAFVGFVEWIGWNITDAGSARCTLQVSPNPPINQRSFVWDTSRWAGAPGSYSVTCAAGDLSLVIPTVGGTDPITINPASYPLDVLVDDEQITLTTPPGSPMSPQTFTGVVRGVNGTTAAAHTAADVTFADQGVWIY